MKNVEPNFLASMVKDYIGTMAKHLEDETPGVYDKPNIVEYEVLPPDYDDYSSCRLKDLRSGREVCDEKSIKFQLILI